MLKIGLFFLFCVISFGAQSVGLDKVGTATTSGQTSYAGDATVSFYLEDITPPVSNQAIITTGIVNVTHNTTNTLTLTMSGNTSCTSSNVFTVSLSGRPTTHGVVLKIHRNATNDYIAWEMWNANGSGVNNGYATGSDTCTAQSGRNLTNVSIGNIASVAKLGFLRMSLSSEPLGGLPPSGTNTPGTFYNYEFQNDGVESAHGWTMTWGAETPTFYQTYESAPACNAGATTSVRAGYPLTLSGALAFGTDGSPLTYMWHLTGQPANSDAMLVGHDTMNPTVTGTVFGQYDFALTVTDGKGLSSSCTVSHGAAATNEDGVIVTGNSAVDKILGPSIKYGSSVWPGMDRMHKAFADYAAARIGVLYTDESWTSMTGTGTIGWNFSTSTSRVYGVGTTLKTDICNGGTSPVNAPSGWIIARFTDPIDGTPVYWRITVTSCISETEVAIDTASLAGVNPAPPSPLSNLAWRIGGSSYVQAHADWTGTNQPTGYYDPIRAYYALYYRSGLNVYRDKARIHAAMWWTFPSMSNGLRTHSLMSSEERKVNLTGMILYALDGHAETWVYIRRVLDKIVSDYAIDDGAHRYGDRDWSYMLEWIALGGMFDPVEANRPGYKLATKTWLTATNGFLNKQKPTGDWEWQVSGGTLGGTVNVVHGSDLVTRTGGTFSASYANSNYFLSCDVSATSNAGCDPGPLPYHSITVIDSTHIRLRVPYNNPACPGPAGCNRKFFIGLVPGWGTQPFHLGIMGAALSIAAYAMEDGDYDLTVAANVRTAMTNLAAWLLNSTYGSHDPVWRGMFYVRNSPMCEPNPGIGWRQGESTGNPDLYYACISLSGEGASRDYWTETTRLMSEVMVRGAAVGDTYDNLYGGMWGGVNKEGPHSDDYAAGGSIWGPSNSKYFGFAFGGGQSHTWPAARTLSTWPLTAAPVTMRVSGSIASVTGATQAKVSVKDANGVQISGSPFTCAELPCNITLPDRTSGNHYVRIDYWSADTLLAPGTYNWVNVLPN